jgi:hypothetical protein
MSDTIKNCLHFTGVPIGSTAALPHHLVMNGHPLAPDVVWLQFLQDFEWVSSNTATLTIRNLSSVSGNCICLVEAWHPIERSFGLVPDDGTFSKHLTPQPFVIAAIPAPAPPAPAFTMFTYEVTGLEPDLTDIAITLPTPRADANYGVQPCCQGVTNISAFDIENKTTTGFDLITVGRLQANDVILFVIGELTP